LYFFNFYYNLFYSLYYIYQKFVNNYNVIFLDDNRRFWGFNHFSSFWTRFSWFLISWWPIFIFHLFITSWTQINPSVIFFKSTVSRSTSRFMINSIPNKLIGGMLWACIINSHMALVSLLKYVVNFHTLIHPFNDIR
jgi:hypothetical protein